jgi:pyridinium-3,5-biscarboxylic acid mononucleotide sulfurtransferase
MADLEQLRADLAELGHVVTAFSGGADSAFLAWVANDTLGPEHAVAVTAVSPSLPASERNDCAQLASTWGLRWLEVETDEMTNAAYRRNDADRCFHCKDALMDAVAPIAARERGEVVLGVNLDDLGDHRPGQRAAQDRGARFPLVDASFTKADVRSVSHQLGLATWDKPAAACLASRIPYGTEVSVGVLGQVEQAERGLRALGFASLRVRHYDDLARIEVPIVDLPQVVEHRDEVVAVVRDAGYRYVTVDLEGLRSGNLNAALTR